MTDRMLNNRINKLAQLEAQKKELEAQIASIKEEIQMDMSEKGVEDIDTGKFLIRWTNVLSSKFDSSAFKAAEPALYNMFSKPSAYRRFSYATK